MSTPGALVQKLWSYCNILSPARGFGATCRDDEPATYLSSFHCDALETTFNKRRLDAKLPKADLVRNANNKSFAWVNT
jgi:hypothetical protein